ncbi:HNH endonuclease [Lutimonas vermicola]|uniref:HNH endonuclease n=1 Tax=Lutimonas vermicola TaxID=414288 RepID=A0ABU9KZN6_9FLAO
MSQTSFVKRLYASNLGEAGMHDKYITVPKKADPPTFFGHPPKNITFIDKNTDILYDFPFSHAANGEYRLTQFGNYFDDKNAVVDDEVIINKIISGVSIKYEIDLKKKGIPIPYPINTLLPDEVNDDVQNSYSEGTKMTVLVNKYERNTKARDECIDHYGAFCSACEFDFSDEYGDIGKGFIHVHHIKPISEIGESYEVDPINDLIPVCPNCHAMIHKRKPPYSIKEIKGILG